MNPSKWDRSDTSSLYDESRYGSSSSSAGSSSLSISSLVRPIPPVHNTPFAKHVYNSGLRDEAADIAIPPRSTSPVPSVFSVSSSIREKFFLRINGRKYGNHMNHSYLLPADEEELVRNETLHGLLKSMRGGRNYVGPVRQALRPSPDRDKAVLDLGCGTGLWLRDMSQEFPWVSFVGVDLVPIQPKPLAPNCRVEIDDFNLSLRHFYNSFDMVHGRKICGGVASYPSLISEIHKTLHPSGLVLFQEFMYTAYQSTHEPFHIPLPDDYIFPSLPPTRHHFDFNYTTFWMLTLKQAFIARNGRVDQSENVDSLLREHGGFEEFGEKDTWIPIGPWYNPPTTAHEWAQNYLGELERRNILALLSSSQQIIRSFGMSPEDWDELETNIVRECTTDCERLRMMARLRAVWARKRDPGIPTTLGVLPTGSVQYG